MENIKKLSEKITKLYGKMSPNFRKIATFVLNNPDDVAFSSMRENARSLGLDPSNFVRFARHLSFKGYPQMRELFQHELTNRTVGYLDRALNLQSQQNSGEDETKNELGQPNSIVEDIQLSAFKGINTVFENNSEAELEKSASILLAANKIYVFGLRICFPAAYAFHYTMKMIRDRVYLSDGVGGTAPDDLRGMTENDVILSIGTTPYSNDTVNATRYGVKCGAKVIVLTDDKLSPMAQDADVAHIFKSSGQQILGSIVPLMTLVETLTTIMISKSGNKALDAIKVSEEQLREFHSYYSEDEDENEI